MMNGEEIQALRRRILRLEAQLIAREAIIEVKDERIAQLESKQTQLDYRIAELEAGIRDGLRQLDEAERRLAR